MEFSPEQLEDLWDEVSSDLSAVLQGRADLPHDVTPFDAASEVDEDQQRSVTIACHINHYGSSFYDTVKTLNIQPPKLLKGHNF